MKTGYIAKICRLYLPVKKAGGNQISHDSENSAGNSTQIDKQNDNEKEITILIFL